jgi:hypothetical protein
MIARPDSIPAEDDCQLDDATGARAGRAKQPDLLFRRRNTEYLMCQSLAVVAGRGATAGLRKRYDL